MAPHFSCQGESIPEHIVREQKEILESLAGPGTEATEDESLSLLSDGVPVHVIREQQELLAQAQRQNSANLARTPSRGRPVSSLRPQCSTRSVGSSTSHRRSRSRDGFSASTARRDNLGGSEREMELSAITPAPGVPRAPSIRSAYSLPSPPTLLESPPSPRSEVDVDSVIVQRIQPSNCKSGRLSYNHNNSSFDDFKVGAFNIIGAGESPAHPSDQLSQGSVPTSVMRRPPSESDQSTITDTYSRRLLYSSEPIPSVLHDTVTEEVTEEPSALPVPDSIVNTNPTMGPDQEEAVEKPIQRDPEELNSTLKYFMGGGLCFLAMGGAVILILAFVVDIGLFKGTTQETSVTPAPSVYITEAPTTPSPTASPRPKPVVLDLDLEIPTYTLDTIRQDLNSPQAQAYEWLREDIALGPSRSQDRQYQRFALATLYFSTKGELWKTSTGWLDHDLDECEEWVTWADEPSLPAPYRLCDPNTRLLESLDLFENDLIGFIPPELSLLTTLKYVDFSRNNLKSAPDDKCLPTQLGLLDQLEHFDIFWSYACGTIPSEIGMLSNLKTLQLEKNEFKGTIPTSVGSMTNLENFMLRSNHMSGTLPSEFAVPLGRTLWVLDVGHNSLTGQVPDSFGEAMALRQDDVGVDNDGELLSIMLEGNQLTGTIPQELCILQQRLDFDCKKEDSPEEGVCGCTCECPVDVQETDPDVDLFE